MGKFVLDDDVSNLYKWNYCQLVSTSVKRYRILFMLSSSKFSYPKMYKYESERKKKKIHAILPSLLSNFRESFLVPKALLPHCIISHPVGLVHLSCYNKIPQTGWLINNRSPWSGCQNAQILVKALFWVINS